LKGFKHIVYIAVCSFVWHYFVFFQPSVYAEESLGETFDCTDVSVDYLEDPTLTREERLRRMDQAFFQSVNKFELCQEAKKTAKAAGGAKGAANGGGNGGGEGGDSGDAGGETGGPSAGESVASSTMSGTETPQKYPSAEGVEADEAGAQQSSQDRAEAGSKTGGDMKRSNGKLPEDIPPAQNDDALAAQIRYAAENETDPVKRMQLWNEYRKYKGLATK
jgi:hypothetical protein